MRNLFQISKTLTFKKSSSYQSIEGVKTNNVSTI